jgi:hypothetical protein
MLRRVLAEVLSETSRIRRRWWPPFDREPSGLMSRREAFGPAPRAWWELWWKGFETEFPSNADVSLTTLQARGPNLSA